MRSSAYSRSLSTRRPERDGCRLPTAGRTCVGFFAAGAFDLGVLGELKTCRGFAGGDGLVRAAGGMGDAGGDPCWEELVDAWPPCFCWRLARRSAAWRKKSSRLSLIGLVACSCVSKERSRSRGRTDASLSCNDQPLSRSPRSLWFSSKRGVMPPVGALTRARWCWCQRCFDAFRYRR